MTKKSPAHGTAAMFMTIGIAASMIAGGRETPRPINSDSNDTGMAKIILEAHDVMGNGFSGFQLLLDADAEAYGNQFFGPGSFFWGDYSSFEYSIPEDATAEKSTKTVVVDGAVELFVPAGTYDWMVILPDAEALQIINGEYSTADDFEFKAGCEYTILVENRPNDWGFEEPQAVLNVDNDLAATAVILPESALDLSGNEQVGLEIRNNGTQSETNFGVYFTANDGERVTERFKGTLNPGETAIYTFDTTADMSAPGTYTVTAGVDCDTDMIPANNLTQAKCRHLTAISLPYSYDFSNKEEADIMEDWAVANVNGDYSTWSYNEWRQNRDGQYGVMNCSGNYSGDFTGDDWLITGPLMMEAGANHVIVDLCTVSKDTPERMEVWIGSSQRPEEMTRCGEFEIASEEWEYRAANLNVEKDGVYYMALRDASVNGMNLFLASVNIDKGEFVGKPDLKIENLILPASNCDLPKDYRIGMRVTNKGLGTLENYTLTADINTDRYISTDGVAVAPGETRDIYMPQLMDFSGIGKYDVTMGIDNQFAEASMAKTVECFEPVVDLPASANFSNGQFSHMWTMLNPEAWSYMEYFNDFSSEMLGKENGLLSRGVSLEHDARFKISYAGSGWGVSLHVYFGKAGSDPMDYEEVYVNPEVTSDAVELEFDVPVATPGNYSFLVSAEGEPGMRNKIRLNEIVISQIMACDGAILNVDAPVSLYLPESQTGINGIHNVSVTNRGSEALRSFSVSVLVDGQIAGKSDVDDILVPGETAGVTVRASLPNFKDGENFEVSYILETSEADGNETDNTFRLPTVNVTDYVRANENLETRDHTVGEYMSPLYVGNIYRLGDTADLTSVVIGLGDSDYDKISGSIITFSIYQTDGDKVGQRIYHQAMERGEGGFETIDMADMRLEPGLYYFEVGQTSTNHMGLAWDINTPADCYQREGDTLTKVRAYALCIRAEFGPVATVYAKDAEAIGFESPALSEGLFFKDETVTATVRNSGYDQSSFTVTLFVDGMALGDREVSLMPYNYSAVSFEGVDLSVPGRHELRCECSLSDDENDSNNYFATTINSAEELDPYSFDFEGCDDFATGGDRLNPQWTTFDRNNVYTNGYWRYDYPHHNEPTGFLAFNPSKTTPSMDDMPLEGFTPHSGKRFGAAFMLDVYSEGGEGVEHADVWLMSPRLTLGNGSHMELYAKTRMLETPESALEPFQIMVSEASDDPDEFVCIGNETLYAPVEDWGLFDIDLSEFDGKDVYLAVRYVGMPFKSSCLMVDDINILTNMTGADTIENTEAVTEYYTFDGIKVIRPTKGIYIKRQGLNTMKIVVK